MTLIHESDVEAAALCWFEGLGREARLFALTFTTKDMGEGTRAFIEKREPRFTGK